MFKGDRARKETLVDYGFRLPSALDNRPLRFDEWEAMRPQTVFVSATPGGLGARPHRRRLRRAGHPPDGAGRSGVSRCDRRSTQVDDLLAEIKETVGAGDRVLVTTLTKRMAEDLTEYLDDAGLKVRYMHSDIDTVERVEIIRDLRLGFRRAGRHQPAARGPRYPRGGAGGDPRCGQGRLFSSVG